MNIKDVFLLKSLAKEFIVPRLHPDTIKDENREFQRGETPLAGVWGCPPSSTKSPQRLGGWGVEKAIIEGESPFVNPIFRN